MKRVQALLLGLVAVMLVVRPLPSPAQLPLIRWEGRTMGSPYTVQIVGTNLSSGQVETLKLAVGERLQEINRQMSHYRPDSELSQFNRAPANIPFKVSPEFANVVRFSLDLFQRSRGAFDPTLAPVINLWGFGEKTDQRVVPLDSELKAALKLTGCQHLSVTDNDELVKDIPELTINLSAVAKGFAVDEMVRVLRGQGLTNLHASIAGEVRVLGLNTRGTHWQVGIAAPVAHWNEDDPMAAVASLFNQALSTSGDYQKFFTDPQGRRLSHIIDPKTGWPLQHNVRGVSVVAPDSMTADALGTALFVMGVEQGLQFIASYTNAAALFIVREPNGEYRQIWCSGFPLPPTSD